MEAGGAGAFTTAQTRKTLSAATRKTRTRHTAISRGERGRPGRQRGLEAVQASQRRGSVEGGSFEEEREERLGLTNGTADREGAQMSHPNQAMNVLDGTEDRASGWRETLDRVVPAVVVLRVVSTRPFDTEVAGSSHATGFVVDRARGLILTNRHVRTTDKSICVWHHSRARTC